MPRTAISRRLPRHGSRRDGEARPLARGSGARPLQPLLPRFRGLVDRAVEELKEAVRLDADFAEAHALLSTLYPRYYRLDPARAAVVGPLGDEHLATALRLEPENPRVLTLKAIDFVYSPARHGGDPDRGLDLLDQTLARFDAEASARGPEPSWGDVIARVWYVQIVLSRGIGDRDRAAALIEEALAVAPDFSLAETLRSRLQESNG